MKKPPQQPPVSAVKCMAMSLLHSEPNSCAIFKTNIHFKKSFHLLVLPAAQMESCKAPWANQIATLILPVIINANTNKPLKHQ